MRSLPVHGMLLQIKKTHGKYSTTLSPKNCINQSNQIQSFSLISVLIFKINSIAEDIPIYNYVSSVENPLTWGQFTDQNIRNGFDFPFSTAIWYVSFHMHKTAFMNRIYMLFLHLLPALFIDLLTMCVGQRPQMLKMYKKIHKFSSVISFFCTNEWVSVENEIVCFEKNWLLTKGSTSNKII